MRNQFYGNRLKKEIEKNLNKNLKRVGSAMRTTARRSIRRRKKVSAPGSPPSAHSSNSFASIKNIQFAVEKNVLIVGPIALSNNKDVPKTLEEGGVARIQYAFVFKSRTNNRYVKLARLPNKLRGRKRGIKIVTDRKSRARIERVRRRPFMKPAFDTIIKDIDKYMR